MREEKWRGWVRRGREKEREKRFDRREVDRGMGMEDKDGDRE